MKTPQTIKVYYFSGTGNTEKIAETYVDGFKRAGIESTATAIENIVNTNECTHDSELIGIGYPVHCFDAPQIIFDFIKTLPVSNGTQVFLFKTMADPIVNGGSTNKIRHLLKHKGYDVFHESIFVMPSNWFKKYAREVSQILWRTARQRINLFIPEIITGQFRRSKPTLFAKFMTSLGTLERFRARMFGMFLTVRHGCRGCGTCVSLCPQHNISITKSKPDFGWKCMSCMRCIYKCPQRNIHFHFFDTFILKSGYDVGHEFQSVKSGLSHNDTDICTPLPPRLKRYLSEHTHCV